MSDKFSLTPAPTFKARVDIAIAGGKTASVEFTFKHRTKDEFDEWRQESEGKSDVDLVMEMASAWNLQDAWSTENVTTLVQNYHGAAAAISRTYAGELLGVARG